MISDAQKNFLDIVTKHFFSCRKIFFVQQEHFSFCKKKILAKKNNPGARITTALSKRNLLGVGKKNSELRSTVA